MGIYSASSFRNVHQNGDHVSPGAGGYCFACARGGEARGSLEAAADFAAASASAEEGTPAPSVHALIGRSRSPTLSAPEKLELARQPQFSRRWRSEKFWCL